MILTRSTASCAGETRIALGTTVKVTSSCSLCAFDIGQKLNGICVKCHVEFIKLLYLASLMLKTGILTSLRQLQMTLRLKFHTNYFTNVAAWLHWTS